MVISYSQHSSLRDALKNTFDGKHPCCICKVIKGRRHCERNGEQQKLLVKMDFYIQSTTGPALFPPSLATVPQLMLPGYCRITETPPTPPPILA
jgi:hypothetical protein